MITGTMLRVYIAGPMTGIPEYNYPAFKTAQQQLSQAGYQPLNPASHDITGEIRSWQHYMRHGLRLLLEADAVATLPGWSKSRGATLEVNVAEALGMDVRSIEDWVNPT